ncbi:MAG: hypothetical protein AAF349_12105 [Cyanobacteria bacterium P01_A01_bin.68]
MTYNQEISITQLSYGMTPEELISEGYMDVDDFYDPNQEELNEQIKEIQNMKLVVSTDKKKKDYTNDPMHL